MRQARHRAARPVGDRGDRARRGTTTTATWTVHVRATADGPRTTLDGARGDLARSASSTGRTSRRSRARTPSPGRRSTPARWDHTVDLAGKRVAMIGAGASGFQIAPAIAPDVEQLTVFQRTAQWMFPNPNYHEQVGPGVQWALTAPAVLRPLVPVPDLLAGLRQGPRGRTGRPGLSRTSRRRSARSTTSPAQMFTDWIVEPGRRRSRAARQGGARLPGDRQAHAAGQRQLAAHADPRQRRAGPHRHRPHRARRGRDRRRRALRGRRHRLRHRLPRDQDAVPDGRSSAATASTSRERWGERPAAYLGITVPEFPNFFCMYGPGTNLAHGGSLIFHSECQMRYITQCLELTRSPAVTGPWSRARTSTTTGTSAPRPRCKTLVWSQPSIKHSFFKNAHGEIHGLSPWRLVDYWTLDPRARPRRLRDRLTGRRCVPDRAVTSTDLGG